jgi:hypothetical protein
MTKAGQPSLVRDIRFFAGSCDTYVSGCHEATAFGRRVSFLLRSRGYSFGSWHHLYIRAVEGDRADTPAVALEGAEWWHRFVEVTVPPGFAAMHEGERTQLLIARTKSVLRSLFSMNGIVLEELLAEAERERDRLRFLVKRKNIGGRSVEVSFNVAVWPHPSDLLVVVKDSAAHVDLASPPIKLKIHDDAFSLVGDIRQDGDAIRIVPRKSFTAQLVAAGYGSSLTIPLSAFRPLVGLPPTSHLIAGST